MFASWLVLLTICGLAQGATTTTASAQKQAPAQQKQQPVQKQPVNQQQKTVQKGQKASLAQKAVITWADLKQNGDTYSATVPKGQKVALKQAFPTAQSGGNPPAPAQCDEAKQLCPVYESAMSYKVCGDAENAHVWFITFDDGAGKALELQLVAGNDTFQVNRAKKTFPEKIDYALGTPITCSPATDVYLPGFTAAATNYAVADFGGIGVPPASIDTSTAVASCPVNTVCALPGSSAGSILDIKGTVDQDSTFTMNFQGGTKVVVQLTVIQTTTTTTPKGATTTAAAASSTGASGKSTTSGASLIRQRAAVLLATSIFLFGRMKI